MSKQAFKKTRNSVLWQTSFLLVSKTLAVTTGEAEHCSTNELIKALLSKAADRV